MNICNKKKENKYAFTISSGYHTDNIKNIQDSVKKMYFKVKNHVIYLLNKFCKCSSDICNRSAITNNCAESAHAKTINHLERKRFLST